MRWLQQHSFILLCVVFTVSSQLIMRWRVGAAGALPPETSDRISFVLSLLMTPWIWMSIALTFLGGVSWMLALTRFELSYAFPFTGASYVVMLFAGALVFNEHVGLARIVGTLLVLFGLIVIVRS